MGSPVTGERITGPQKRLVSVNKSRRMTICVVNEGANTNIRGTRRKHIIAYRENENVSFFFSSGIINRFNFPPIAIHAALFRTRTLFFKVRHLNSVTGKLKIWQIRR